MRDSERPVQPKRENVKATSSEGVVGNGVGVLEVVVVVVRKRLGGMRFKMSWIVGLG